MTSVFADAEARDAVRFSWNVFPTTKADGQKMQVPVAAIYTPLKPLEGMGTVSYKPIQCAKCSAVLNPYW